MFIPVLIYRLGNFFHRNGFPWIGKLISIVNRFLFAVWIPSSATIGKKFVLGYGGLGVVIHSNTVIGDRVTVSQNVTIGRNFGDKKVPVIGDDVYIGAGSVIFGEITVGDNAIIGSNSVVNRDVPMNSTVAGNPFRIIRTGRLAKYYEIDGKQLL